MFLKQFFSTDLSLNHNNFRQDIVFLRAFSVIAVVLFHCNLSIAKGGYIGVDIFFVISGYLITKNILNLIGKNKFNLKTFFIRRINRLAPSLAVTLILTSIATFYYFPASLINEYIDSFIASILNISNFYFYKTSDYFSTDSHLKPLLHTWSLTIEEQFYLIWAPLLLVIGKKIGIANWKKVTLVIFISSFITAEYFANTNKMFAFFMPFTRFYEFGFGALAVGLERDLKNNNMSKNIKYLIIFLLGISVYLYQYIEVFPGISAAIPCFLTFLYLVIGPNVKVFDINILNKIGDSSYSIYLLHWPLIVFYTYVNTTYLNLAEQLVLFISSLIFGYFQYYYIEDKLRNHSKTLFNRSHYYFYTSTVVVIFSILTFHYYYKNFYFENTIAGKMLTRIGELKKDYYENLNLNYPNKKNNISIGNAHTCSFDNTEDIKTLIECIDQKTENEKFYFLIGDSSGRDVFLAMKKAYPKINIVSINHSSCPPFQIKRKGRKECFKNIEKIIKKYSIDQKLKGIILSSISYKSNDSFYTKFKTALNNYSKYTNNILITGPTIKLNRNIRDLIHGHKYININKLNEHLNKNFDKKQIAAIEKLNLFIKEYRVPYFSIAEHLCSNSKCKIIQSHDKILIWDKLHLSRQGIENLAEYLKRKKFIKYLK